MRVIITKFTLGNSENACRISHNRIDDASQQRKTDKIHKTEAFVPTGWFESW